MRNRFKEQIELSDKVMHLVDTFRQATLKREDILKFATGKHFDAFKRLDEAASIAYEANESTVAWKEFLRRFEQTQKDFDIVSQLKVYLR